MVCRSSEVKGSAAVASFTCEQEVSSCHVTVTMGTVHVVAQTVEGVLHMFNYPLTNQIGAPISAHSTVQFTTGATSEVGVQTLVDNICYLYVHMPFDLVGRNSVTSASVSP